MCSRDSGGSLYIRLLDLLLLFAAVASILSAECRRVRFGGRLSPAKVKPVAWPVGWRSREDSLAVLASLRQALAGFGGERGEARGERIVCCPDDFVVCTLRGKEQVANEAETLVAGRRDPPSVSRH